ncbi:MAG: thioredoxin domain-containing protein [Thermodesulfobacteriota bacterium]
MKKFLILTMFFGVFLAVACDTGSKEDSNDGATAETKTESNQAADTTEIPSDMKDAGKDVKAEAPDKDTESRLISFFKAKYGTRLPGNTEVKLGDFEASTVKGMDKGSFIVAVPGRGEQPIPFFIGSDRKHIIIGVAEATNLSNFEQSEIEGLKQGTINFGRQPLPILISNDGSQLIVGEILDSSVDPLQDVISKITLEDVPLKGSKDAKITVVEYSDFQCPFCKRASDMLPSLMEQYDGKIKVIFKQLPLPNHNWAKPASIASLCAYEQDNDKFWEYHDLIFASQREITLENSNEKFKEFAKQAGLNEADFDKCLTSEAVAAKVDAEINEATQIGVSSTPTFIIDGIVVPGADTNKIKAAIDSRM